MKIKLLFIILFLNLNFVNAKDEAKQNFRTFGNHLNWLIAHEYDNEIKVPDNNWEYKRVSAEYLKKKKECKGKTDMLCTKILNGTISWSKIYTKNSLGYYLEYGTPLSQMANSIEIKIKEYIKTNKTDIETANELISFAVDKLSNIKSDIDIKKLKKDLKVNLEDHYKFNDDGSDVNDDDSDVSVDDKKAVENTFLSHMKDKLYCKAYKITMNKKNEFIKSKYSKQFNDAKDECKKSLINKLIDKEYKEDANEVLKNLVELHLIVGKNQNGKETKEYRNLKTKIKGKKTKNGSNWIFDFLPWILMILSLGVSYYLFFKMQKYKELSGKNIETMNKQVEQLVHDKERLKDLHKREKAKLDKRCSELHKKNLALNAKINEGTTNNLESEEQYGEKRTTEQVEWDVEPSHQITSKNIKYLSMSTQEGIFIKCRDDIKVGQTYYKLVISPTRPNHGNFTVIEGNKHITKSLLQNIRDYLKRVCDVENENIDNPRGIQVKTHGTAIFNGRQWSVDRKARIRLF